MTPQRGPDILGDPYTQETLELRPDDEGPVVATLVHRPADGEALGAVLHVHGFADYFFHTEYAEWWTARGYDFYALDLRKYGRSLRAHQTPNYVDDLGRYYEELDEAWWRIQDRDGHRRLVLSAHSTGGLIVSLWAHDRQPILAGTVLNAPWLDLNGPWLVRNAVTGQLISQIGARRPRREIRRAADGVYGRSLHREHGGEWDYDLDWKPLESWPIYFGWLRAVRRGHQRVHRGLDLPGPLLVLTSAGSARPGHPDEDEAERLDVVLDVAQIRHWAPSLGEHVTIVAIPGARHDVVLSAPAAREHAYAELGRWASAYALPPRDVMGGGRRSGRTS